ncbi:MAG: O-acetyl-ADP-ribose deacetylase [Nesterenkonia sp.]
MRTSVIEGDITAQEVDAIVNAANSSLMGGGGVDGAIHRAAGPQLLEHCKRLRETGWPDGLPPGEAVLTPGADLKARYVIHTVGPNRTVGETDPQVLESCFRRSLQEAAANAAQTIAFPAIGAGVYGWDPADVAEAAHRVLTDEAALVQRFTEIRFVLFSEEVSATFRQRF